MRVVKPAAKAYYNKLISVFSFGAVPGYGAFFVSTAVYTPYEKALAGQVV